MTLNQNQLPTGRRLLLGDLTIGAIVVKEAVTGIAGSRDSDRRFVGALIATAVVAKSAKPVLERTFHDVQRQTRKTQAALRRLYGG